MVASPSIRVADLEMIDAHVHLWRTIEHERRALPIPGRRDRDRWGTPEAAIRELDRSGISKLVFLNVMPTVEMIEAQVARLPDDLDAAARFASEQRIREEMAERIRRQNAWACGVGAQYERLVPFVGVQPLLGTEGAVEEVRRGHERGAMGVKLQPGMNRFLPADRSLWPVYEAVQELGLPILTDSGTYGAPAPDGRPYGEPVNFVEVLEAFPRLTLVMAHFGSAYWDERVELALRFPNLQFDVSGGFQGPGVEARDGARALAEEDAPRLMRKVGVERFMFGTDGPAVMPQPYIEQMLRLDLADDEMAMVMAGNCGRLYHV